MQLSAASRLSPIEETATSFTGVRLKTTRFGEISADEEIIITMPEGVIGFEDCTRYVVVHQDEKSPFKWLQSLDDGAVAFPIIDPWQFKADYAPTLAKNDAAWLELTEETPKLVFVIVTIPRDNPRGMTANLLGPLVINGLTRRGKQMIVEDTCYTTKHSIMEELQKGAEGAAE